MKKVIVLVLVFIIPVCLFAQFKNNKWLMGTNTHLPPPWGGTKIEFEGLNRNVNLSPHKMWFSWNYSGLSDKNENWFLYTNGVSVCNINNDTIINGNGLSPFGDDPVGNSWYNLFLYQTLFLPFDSSNQYLFHSNRSVCVDLNHPFYGQPLSLNLFYSSINSNIGNGQSEIISKNNIIISDSLCVGKIQAVRHANGRDWWVITRHFYYDKYYSILVTTDSVHNPIEISTNGLSTAFSSQVCTSPNGKYYASFSNLALQQLRIYDIDRCTGMLYNFRQKFITQRLGGHVAFSPNSRYLYIGSLDSLWQFDMLAENVFDSQTLVGVYDGAVDELGWGYIFGFMWLAPDGKIYMNANNEQNKLHVINNPDMPGAACNFVQRAVDLPTYNSATTPTPINYNLKQLSGSPCDTLGVGIRKLKVNSEQLKVFPNPSNGRFSIEYPAQEISGMLLVYDAQGKEVYREYVSPYSIIKTIDLSKTLSAGMYGVSLVFGNERLTRTVVISEK